MTVKRVLFGIMILSGLACLLLYVVPMIIGGLIAGGMGDAGTIGIIGGADGPTSIFVSGEPGSGIVAGSGIRVVALIVFALSFVSWLYCCSRGRGNNSP